MTRFISLIVLGILGFGCTENATKQSATEAGLQKMEDKSAPFDHFYFQRAFPDTEVDYKAMQRSLREAKVFSAANLLKSTNEPWTEIGPSNIGGRINCIAVHPTNQDIILTGTAGGGVFRTTDGGAIWAALTDDLAYLPIGHIAFDPVTPTTIYVGTGDVNISGTVWIGNGIYKSTDNGLTWNNIGLVENRIISKIIVNPENPSQLFVGTMGVPFQENQDRGLYRSDDGGDTWEQILFVSEDSGVIDLAMNHEDPSVLYAVTWNRIRTSFFSLASGDEAGIYKTTDGGETWTELTNGLPEGPMSRIGIKLWEGNPDVLFAEYVGTDFQLHGIYKSSNAGDSFSEINTSGLPFGVLGGFGWYFAKIGVSPYDQNEISLLGVDIFTTFDGGNIWEMSAPMWSEYEVHADKHAIEYLGPNEVLLATDGGLYRTTNGFQTWSDIDRIPNTQYYRVTTNPHVPTMVLAGAQDNGTTLGYIDQPDEDHSRFFGGDGFTPMVDPVDPTLFYMTTQNGNFYYTFTDLIDFFDFGFLDEGIDEADRVNWDAPFLMDPSDNTVLYTGTDRIYKMEEAPFGVWEPISPVLVDPSAEFFTRRNVSCISKSALDDQLIYAGTTDSKVWVSQNDGGTWTEITTSLPEYYVTDIKASRFDPATVIVSFSGYRDYDSTPHLYRSTDYGTTWEPITGDLAEMPINHVEMLDPLTYFIATDNGVYATTNGGINWERLGNNMPFVVVLDLHIEPVQNILIAATFARSLLTYSLEGFDVVSSVADNQPREKLILYPNPANDVLNLSNAKGEIQRFEIYSNEGKKVKNGSVGAGAANLQINVADLSAGVYLAVGYNAKDERQASGRFVVSGR